MSFAVVDLIAILNIKSLSLRQFHPPNVFCGFFFIFDIDEQQR
ncbi:hypothetical protein SE951_06805 [Escherichia coli]|nr:hypothetical protein [Escherichia coli]